MKKGFYLFTLIILVLAFAACAQNDDEKHYFEQGWHLKLVEYKTSNMEETRRPMPTAFNDRFVLTCRSDGDTYGFGEVNSFTANYNINGDRISFVNLKSSNNLTKYGDEEIFFSLLRLVTKFKFKGDKLYMYVENDDNYLMFDDIGKVSVVSSTIYRLPKGAQWVGDREAGVVYRANSMDELKAWVSMDEEVELNDVDFSKKTLLLLSGTSMSGISSIDHELTKKGANYKLSIFVEQSAATVVQQWTVAIVVDKLANDASINTDIVYSSELMK